MSANPHKHCPNDCEKPQQFLDGEGNEWCGKCWVLYGVLSQMVLCTPDNCD